MSKDVVIIGSGIGGLTCGALLAKNGFGVLILEQHSQSGGYVTSYKRDRFLFDVVHVIGGLRKGAPIERICSYLGLDKKIDFTEVDKTFKFIYPDMTVDCYTDINKYQQEVIDKFPDEREGIHQYFTTIKKIWEEILRSHYNPNFLQLLSYPVRYPNLVRYQNKTHQQFLDIFFKSEKLKEVLGSGWGYLGLNNPRISALYLIGMYIRVTKILIEDKRAAGVELEDGEQIRAAHVISNADTKKTFLNLVGKENLSRKFDDRINGLQQSVSGFVVHLGVKAELPKELHCGCIMYFPAYGIAENFFHLAGMNEMETDPEKIGFGLSISTMKDPSLAPDGCHALDIITMPAPYRFKNNWMAENKDKYNELKDQMADSLIKAAEKLIPGLSKHIVVKDISTPLTYERYTAATEGGWYDEACTPGQSLLKRMPAKTPIKNLYLTGAKTFPGPGMFGAMQSGLFTADIILDKKLTKGRYVLNVY